MVQVVLNHWCAEYGGACAATSASDEYFGSQDTQFQQAVLAYVYTVGTYF